MSGVEPAGYPKPREYGPVTVRRIGRSEARDAIHLLALTFVDEPALRHVLGGTPRRRLRVLIPLMWAFLKGYPRSVEIHGAWLDGKLAGVGLRMLPGAWPVGRWEALNGWVWGLLGSLPMLVAFPQAVRVFRAAAQQQSHHPDDRPHWYLSTMGVHPSFRRRGVASALARFVIEQADAEGVGCHLDTYGDGTEALYRRLGFEVRDRWEFESGAPQARTMWRDPRRPGLPLQ